MTPSFSRGYAKAIVGRPTSSGVWHAIGYARRLARFRGYGMDYFLPFYPGIKGRVPRRGYISVAPPGLSMELAAQTTMI
jgi:hypothetical protein